MIVCLKVRRTKEDAACAEKEEKFVYAGMMTYEKRDVGWIKAAWMSRYTSNGITCSKAAMRTSPFSSPTPFRKGSSKKPARLQRKGG